MNLQGATALLTGASGGIGQAIAHALAQRGVTLLLTGRRADVLEPLAQATGGRALACDLAERADVERLAVEAADVDLLVANAALPASGPLDSFSVEQLDRALDVNLRAPMLLAHALSPGMARRGRGHFVFVSSLSGKAASPNGAVYSATKFGLRGFALALREDMHPHGVGVSTVFPGFIRDAGMFAEANVTLPRFVGTRTAGEVADGVIAAIERNKAEVDVAPLSVRTGAALSGVAPSVMASLQRRLGGATVSKAIADGQADKR